MISALVVVLVSVIPAIFIAELIARRRAKRRRRTRWMQARAVIPDDQFYTSLGPIAISREGAIRVRSEVGHATKMQANLIAASDNIRELERAGDGPHSTIIDYFTDLLFVDEPKNDAILVTVRDLVIEFGPQLDESAPNSRLS